MLVLAGLVAMFITMRGGALVYPFIFGDSEAAGDSSWVFVQLIAAEFTLLLLAAAVGGLIARSKFVLPAVIVAGFNFGYGVFEALGLLGFQRITLDWSVLALFAMAFAVVAAAAALGAIAGMRLCAIVRSRGKATTD